MKKIWRIYTAKEASTDRVVYVGMTTQLVRLRWSAHLYTAKIGRGSQFSDAIRKYGKEAFVIEQIATCNSKANASATEIAIIAHYDTYRSGYNATTGGEGAHGVARIVSEEERRNISKRNLEMWSDPERKKAISQNMRKPRDPEFGRAISERRKGLKLSEETRKKMSASRVGKKHDPEVRARIAAQNAIRNRSPEHRAKVAAARLLKSQLSSSAGTLQ
jgi:hypothetical protein